MAFLFWIGGLLVAAWLFAWLVFEITILLVHVLLLAGLAALVAGVLALRAGRKRLER